MSICGRGSHSIERSADTPTPAADSPAPGHKVAGGLEGEWPVGLVNPEAKEKQLRKRGQAGHGNAARKDLRYTVC